MRFVVPMAFRARAAACGLVLACSPGWAGCVHADSAADRHLAQLSDGVGTVQADQDRKGRLAQVDDGDEKITTPPVTPASGQATAAARPAHTVQIGTDGIGGDESDDPNDPTARPEIRLQGAAGAASRPVRGKTTRGRGEIKIDPAAPDDGSRSDAPRPSILDPEAKRSYEAAHALVVAKQYDRALEALGAFMTRWPDHPYVENALYWRGEVYFARGEHLRAAEQFEAVFARGGNKAPDALYKIGACHERLGSADRAREYWDRLRRDFPRSDAAKRLPQSSAASTPRDRGPKEMK